MGDKLGDGEKMAAWSEEMGREDQVTSDVLDKQAAAVQKGAERWKQPPVNQDPDPETVKRFKETDPVYLEMDPAMRGFYIEALFYSHKSTKFMPKEFVGELRRAKSEVEKKRK